MDLDKHNQQLSRLTGQMGDTKRVWSTTFAYEPPDETSCEARGSVYVVIDLHASQTMDLALAGKLVFDVLVETYYDETADDSPLSLLEKAVIAGRDRLVSLAYGEASGGTETSLDFNIAVGVVWGKILYLARLGDVTSTLVRGESAEEVGSLTEGTVTVASGVIEEGDVFVLGSSAFRKAVSTDNLAPFVPVLQNTASELSQSASNSFSVNNAYPTDFSVILLAFPGEGAPNSATVVGSSEVVEEGPVEVQEAVPKDTEVPITPPVSALESRRKRNSRIHSFASSVRSAAKRFRPKPPPIYVRAEQKKLEPYAKAPNNSRFFIGGIVALVILFSFSVYYTIAQRRNKAQSSQVITLVGEAQEEVEKARDLVDLNNARAREFLRSAEESLDEAIALTNNEPTKDITQLLDEIRMVGDQVNKISRLSDPKVFYDLQVQSKESQPVAVTGGGSSIFVADSSDGTIYRLRGTNQDVPTIEKVATDDLGAITALLAGSSRLFVVSDAGLSIVSLEDGSVTAADLALSVPWSDIVSADLYVDGLYFLASSSNEIYRTYVDGTDFSDPGSWLGNSINLADASSLTIDGDIYVAKSEAGEVLQLANGEVQDWKVRELDTPLSQPRDIFTTVDSNFLFILDNGNRRIVVVAKEGGLYNRQFVYTGDDEAVWSSLQDVWVDEEESVLYVLDGTRIYAIEY